MSVKEIVWREWTEDELVAEIARVNLLITTDEFAITREMADSMPGRVGTLEANNLDEGHLLLSYDPAIKECPLVRIR